MSREDRLASVGEFVLGLVEGRERAEFEAALRTDAELAAQVDRLTARLSALDDTVEPEAVEPQLWERIRARLDETPQEPAGNAGVVDLAAARQARRKPLAWGSARIAALAASLLVAIGLGYLAGGGRSGSEGPVAIVVLVNETDAKQGAIVEAYADDSVRLSPLQAFAVPDGRIMQVWTLPDKETGPVSLGTLPRSASTVLTGPDLPVPKEGQLYEITLEPAPGSPTGRPTGPILVKGFARLVSAGS